MFIAGASGRTAVRRYRLEIYFGGAWHKSATVGLEVPAELARTQSLPAVALASVGGSGR